MIVADYSTAADLAETPRWAHRRCENVYCRRYVRHSERRLWRGKHLLCPECADRVDTMIQRVLALREERNTAMNAIDRDAYGDTPADPPIREWSFPVMTTPPTMDERFTSREQREIAIQRAVWTVLFPACAIVLLVSIWAFWIISDKADAQAAAGKLTAPGFYASSASERPVGEFAAAVRKDGRP